MTYLRRGCLIEGVTFKALTLMSLMLTLSPVSFVSVDRFCISSSIAVTIIMTIIIVTYLLRLLKGLNEVMHAKS